MVSVSQADLVSQRMEDEGERAFCAHDLGDAECAERCRCQDAALQIRARCKNALECFPSFTVSASLQDEIYCLIGATESRLRREAGAVSSCTISRLAPNLNLFLLRCFVLLPDRMDYEFELDTQECLEQGVIIGMRLAQVCSRGLACARWFGRCLMRIFCVSGRAVGPSRGQTRRSQVLGPYVRQIRRVRSRQRATITDGWFALRLMTVWIPLSFPACPLQLQP
jgi:hypothetical protein